VPSRIHPSIPRIFVAAVGAFIACLTICLALLPRASAAANPAVPVTPLLDCVRFNGDQANPIYTAYFGYNNTGPVRFTFAVGDDNAVAPGSIDAGQPTAFNVGNYPRVFPVQFDGIFVKEVSWELNGVTVTASATSPACTSGVTAAASAVASDSAALNGVVTPDGQDVTYSFEYGTSPSFGQSTPTQDAGSGTQPELVQTALTGLTPSTQYFFRLDTTSDLSGTAHGQPQSFTTPAAGQMTSPLALSTTSLPHATFRTPYTASLAASGGAPTYSWKLTDGSLPAGLSLAASSGVISGTPTAVGTSHFTAKVSDAGTPSPQTATEALSITVDPAATSVQLTASANPVRPRHAVTYTATVSRSAPGSGAPTGKVAFSDSGAPIRCPGGSQSLNLTGVATCTISYSARGTHSVTATYTGDADFTASHSQTFSETVRQGRHHRWATRSLGRDHRQPRS
jgi:hypothetical protein